jgi:hypothetical protein
MMLRVGHFGPVSAVTIEVLTMDRTDIRLDPGLRDHVVSRPGSWLADVDEDPEAITVILD